MTEEAETKHIAIMKSLNDYMDIKTHNLCGHFKGWQMMTSHYFLQVISVAEEKIQFGYALFFFFYSKHVHNKRTKEKVSACE